MRKVTEKVGKAFIKGQSLTVGNTHTDGKKVWLFGNLIAERYFDKDKECDVYRFTLAGWNTKTTWDRVNGILSLLNFDVRFGSKDYAPVIYRKDKPLEFIDSHDSFFFDMKGREL